MPIVSPVVTLMNSNPLVMGRCYFGWR